VELIREEYRQQLIQTRSGWKNWGSSAARNGGPEVLRILGDAQRKIGVVSVLDFGCGLGSLGEYVREHYDCNNLEWHEYDPSTTDVMEHIEPQSLEGTIQWFTEHANTAQFHMIACGPTGKTLPDGRDVHLIQQPIKWWQAQMVRPPFKLMERGEIEQLRRSRKTNRGWIYMERG
jgi:hypothetical protein